MNILILPLDTNPLLSNAWLAGFVDADEDKTFRSSFQNLKNTEISCRFKAEHRTKKIQENFIKITNLCYTLFSIAKWGEPSEIYCVSVNSI